jgi:hypothetical protein
MVRKESGDAVGDSNFNSSWPATPSVGDDRRVAAPRSAPPLGTGAPRGRFWALEDGWSDGDGEASWPSSGGGPEAGEGSGSDWEQDEASLARRAAPVTLDGFICRARVAGGLCAGRPWVAVPCCSQAAVLPAGGQAAGDGVPSGPAWRARRRVVEVCGASRRAGGGAWADGGG